MATKTHKHTNPGPNESKVSYTLMERLADRTDRRSRIGAAVLLSLGVLVGALAGAGQDPDALGFRTGSHEQSKEDLRPKDAETLLRDITVADGVVVLTKGSLLYPVSAATREGSKEAIEVQGTDVQITHPLKVEGGFLLLKPDEAPMDLTTGELQPGAFKFIPDAEATFTNEGPHLPKEMYHSKVSFTTGTPAVWDSDSGNFMPVAVEEPIVPTE